MSARLEKVLYTAHTTTVGARSGHGRSDDGSLDVQLSTPGSGKPGDPCAGGDRGRGQRLAG